MLLQEEAVPATAAPQGQSATPVPQVPKAPPTESASGRIIRPEFTGSTREYFRLWVVNLLFTLVSFGLFSAWAKVRKKKYFYGNTRLDGDSLDYFGQPLAILKGRVVAVAVLAVYAFATEIYPASQSYFWGAGLLLLPWLAARSYTFNARNSAWRGVRFDFLASGSEAAKQFLGRLVVVVVTAGLALPWFLARIKSFVLRHQAFGVSPFECVISARAYYGIYLRSAGLSILLFVPVGALSALFYFNRASVPFLPPWLIFAAPIVLTYLVYAVVHAYLQARTGNLVWNSASAAGVRFESTLGAKDLAKLYLGNLIAIACSAGLLIPWAVVRTYRYRLDHFALIADDDLVHEANPALARVGAAGQELGDVLNLDLGL